MQRRGGAPEQAGWAIYPVYTAYVYIYVLHIGSNFQAVNKKCLCLQLLMEDMQEPPLLFITLIFMRRAAGLAIASPLLTRGSVG